MYTTKCVKKITKEREEKKLQSNKKVLINLKRLVAIIVLFTMFTYIININNLVQAVTIRPREEITEKLDNYPGYTELINKLKEE